MYHLIGYNKYLFWFFLSCSILCCYISRTEVAKQEDAEDDDDMDGLPTDDDDDDVDGSDKEMGVDAEDGDEADSLRLQKLAAQVNILLRH